MERYQILPRTSVFWIDSGELRNLSGGLLLRCGRRGVSDRGRDRLLGGLRRAGGPASRPVAFDTLDVGAQARIAVGIGGPGMRGCAGAGWARGVGGLMSCAFTLTRSASKSEGIASSISCSTPLLPAVFSSSSGAWGACGVDGLVLNAGVCGGGCGCGCCLASGAAHHVPRAPVCVVSDLGNWVRA